MKISELIEKLTAAKEQYGDVDVVDNNDYDVQHTAIQRYAKVKYIFNDNVVERHTGDLDDIYLDDYINSDRFVEQGICFQVCFYD